MVKLIRIFQRPSQRTLLEANLTGITMMIIVSIITAISIILYSNMNVWLKVLTGIGEFGIFLMLSGNLVNSYLQYHAYKLSMGMYGKDDKLIILISQGEDLIKQLNKLIKETKKEVTNGTGSIN